MMLSLMAVSALLVWTFAVYGLGVQHGKDDEQAYQDSIAGRVERAEREGRIIK